MTRYVADGCLWLRQMVREKGVRGLLEAARSRLLHKKYGTNPSAIHPKAAAYHPHSGHIDAQAVRLYEVAAEQGSSFAALRAGDAAFYGGLGVSERTSYRGRQP